MQWQPLTYENKHGITQTCKHTIAADANYRICKGRTSNDRLIYHAWAPGKIKPGDPEHYYPSSTGRWYCIGTFREAKLAIEACEKHHAQQ